MVDTNRTSRVGGPRPAEPTSPAEEWRRKGREFQQEIRQEYLKWNRPERSRGRSASAFGGRIIAQGPRAQEAVRCIEDLARRSPTFRKALNKCLQDNDTLWITLGYGGGNSFATMGARDERMYVNLSQGDLFDLVLHECGHALAKLPDGPLGGIGPNQLFQAQVKRELEQTGGVKAYGTEVKQHAPKPKGA